MSLNTSRESSPKRPLSALSADELKAIEKPIGILKMSAPSSAATSRASSRASSPGTSSPELGKTLVALAGAARIALDPSSVSEEQRKKIQKKVRHYAKEKNIQKTIEKVCAINEDESDTEDTRQYQITAKSPAAKEAVESAKKDLKDLYSLPLSEKSKDTSQFINDLVAIANEQQLDKLQTQNLLKKLVAGDLLKQVKESLKVQPLEEVLSMIDFVYGEKLTTAEYKRRVRHFRLTAYKSIREGLFKLRFYIGMAEEGLRPEEIDRDVKKQALSMVPKEVADRVDAAEIRFMNKKKRQGFGKKPYNFKQFLAKLEEVLQETGHSGAVASQPAEESAWSQRETKVQEKTGPGQRKPTGDFQFIGPGDRFYEEAKKGASIHHLKPHGVQANRRIQGEYTWRGGHFYPKQKILCLPPATKAFVKKKNYYEFAYSVQAFFRDRCTKCGMTGHDAQCEQCPMTRAADTWDLCQRCRAAFHSQAECKIAQEAIMGPVTKNLGRRN